MKILFLTRRFYPEIGGVEKHIFEISKELIARGNEILVVTEKGPKIYHNKFKNYQSMGQSDTWGIKSKRPVKSSYFAHPEANNLKILQLDFGRDNFFKKFKIWSTFVTFIKIFITADVVHCHDVFFWYLPIRFLLPFKKVYVTFHGYESYPLPFKNKLLHKTWEILSSGNICVGKFIQKWYGTNPTYVIYGGVDKNNSKRKFLVNEKYSGFFVGRLDEQTNILEYLDAVRMIKKTYRTFMLHIAGDGKFRKQSEKVGEVLGFIDKPERFFEKYRYAFVSRYLSILEAMAAGRLVFALYDNPIKRDYLKMTPYRDWIVICGSASDLAAKVEYYMKHPKEEAEMIQKASHWVSQQTWSSVTNTYLKLWKKS